MRVARWSRRAMIGLVEGFRGGLATLETIEGWASDGQEGDAEHRTPMMTMDDALTLLLRGESA